MPNTFDGQLLLLLLPLLLAEQRHFSHSLTGVDSQAALEAFWIAEIVSYRQECHAVRILRVKLESLY